MLATVQRTEVSAEIRIQPLEDEALITRTLRHPRIYPHISDDGCPNAAEMEVHLEDCSFFYLGVYSGGEYRGLFCVHPHNVACYEIHTCLLPSAWGDCALRAARAVVAWMFEQTPCQRLITCVPAGNDLALRLAKLAGLTEYGVNPKSLLRGGVLVDQTLLGISKGE
jgi:RimJ/RimL family protein N-acetyltransferase